MEHHLEHALVHTSVSVASGAQLINPAVLG